MNITSNQLTIINNLQTQLTDDFTNGVFQSSSQIIAPIKSWSTFPSATQQAAYDSERSPFAAFLVAMGIDQAGLGTAGSPKVISYLKSPSGSGTLTFVGGLLVAAT